MSSSARRPMSIQLDNLSPVAAAKAGDPPLRHPSDDYEDDAKLESGSIDTADCTTGAGAHPPLPGFRTALLIFIFCFAQFIEISSAAAVIPVLGRIAHDLGITANDVHWVLSAYALSFAAFMLLAGRVSDIYSARYVFTIGFFWAGAFSLGCGFTHSAIPLFVLRALQGLGAAWSIPSAIRLIVLLTPDQKRQGQALQLFALAGGMAATFSSLIGGGIATSADYHWVFWFIACAAIPLSLLAFVLLPAKFDARSRSYGAAGAARLSHLEKFYSLDLVGALAVALFLILFVFSLTEGNRVGWDSPRTLIPLVVGVAVVLPAFLAWEEFGRTRRGYEAALPLKLWKMGNFSVLFLASLISFYCYGAVYITYTTLWSEPPYLFSPWKQAKYFLPIGLATMLQAGFTPILVAKFGERAFLTNALLFAAGGSALLANMNSQDRYWTFSVPGQVLVGLGAGMTYICCSQALIQTGAPEMAGVLGAIWTSALQIGLVISIAICLALATGIDAGVVGSYAGFRAAFYSMTVATGAMALVVLLFMRKQKKGQEAFAQRRLTVELPMVPDTPSSTYKA